MAVRIWLLLLCVCAMLSLPVTRAGAIVPVADVEQSQQEPGQLEGQSEGPSIEADQAPFPDDMRQSERLELATVVARMLANGAGNAQPELPLGGESFLPPLCQAAIWSDLVQCRRQSGAQLLHFAIPPPSRG